MPSIPRILIIAGSDSSGGAGIQADIKTVTMLGGYAASAVTAVTVQNTLGVSAVYPIPADIVAAQMRSVIDDIGVDAVKIGMLGDADLIAAVAAVLRDVRVPIVLDPVMVAKGGASLIADDAVGALVRYLLPLATIVTPNTPELAALTGTEIEDEGDAVLAAQELLGLGARAVLAKGGHLAGDSVADLLLELGHEPRWLRGQRIATPNTHGTGCTLSSAIAARLALGDELTLAVQHARDYVRDALAAGASVRTGAGSGPLNHGFAPQPMRLRPLP